MRTPFPSYSSSRAVRYRSIRLSRRYGHPLFPYSHFSSALLVVGIGLSSPPFAIPVSSRISFLKRGGRYLCSSPLRGYPELEKSRRSDAPPEETSSRGPHPETLQHDGPSQNASEKPTLPLRENIYTIPNLVTASRIFACPVLGWSILAGDFRTATLLLAYAGVSDWVLMLVARDDVNQLIPHCAA